MPIVIGAVSAAAYPACAHSPHAWQRLVKGSRSNMGLLAQKQSGLSRQAAGASPAHPF